MVKVTNYIVSDYLCYMSSVFTVIWLQCGFEDIKFWNLIKKKPPMENRVICFEVYLNALAFVVYVCCAVIFFLLFIE